MAFEDVKPQPVWCIHFWDMSLCKGLVLGKENNGLYVRLDGAGINDIEFIDSGNVFYNEKAAERALFKASLAGKKRPGNRNN